MRVHSLAWFRAAVFLAACWGAAGQTRVDLRTQSKSVDFSGAAETIPFKTGTVLPAVCNTGDLFFNTAAPAGSNVYACTAPNSWTLETGGGGGGGVGSVFAGTLAAIQGTACSPSSAPIAVATDQEPGVNVYACTGTNTWTLQQYQPGAGLAITGNQLAADCNTVACQGSANNFSALGNAYLGRTDIACINNTVSGTTANLLAKFDSAGNCVTAEVTDTLGAIGVVVSGAGTSGTARVARQGTVLCTADTAVTAGHYATIGSSTAGRCGDSAVRPGAGNEVVGLWTTSGAAGTLESVTLLLDSNTGGGGGGSGTVTSAALGAPSWFTVSGSPITSSGTLTFAPAAGQGSHQVIGTCGSATSFGPCALTPGDLPSGYPYSSLTGAPALNYQVVGDNGISQTARSRLNLIPGAGVTLNVADNAGTDSTDVTINATGGGGGSPAGSSGDLQINSSGAFGALHVGTGLASDGTSLAADCATVACQTQTNNFSASGNSYAGRTDIFCTNNATTGTTINLLAKFDASGNCETAASTDTVGIIGIVASGAGTTGTARIARQGTIQCVADNTVTAGDFAVIGTTTAGRCKDTGVSRPAGGNEIIGVFTTSGAAGTLESLTLLLDSNPAGGSTGAMFMWGGLDNTLAAGSSSAMQLGWSGSGSATNWLRSVMTPKALTLQHLSVYISSAQPSDAALTCTVYTGTGTSAGTASSMVVNIPASSPAGLYSDDTDTVALPEGTWAANRCSNSSTAPSAKIEYWSAGSN